MEINKRLFSTIKIKDWKTLTQILSNKPDDIDLNIRDEHNNYLITYIILYNNVEILEFLLKTFDMKLDFIDSDGKNILYIPIKYNYYDAIKLLLNYSQNKTGIPITEVKDTSNKIALHYATEYNNIEITKLLLSYSTNDNINNDGYNSLHIAIIKKSLETVKLLIKDIHNIDLNLLTLHNESPLHICVDKNAFEILNLLLNNNANVNIKNSNEDTCLHYAVRMNNIEIIQLLIKHKADPNIQNMLGHTPLHLSLNENNPECVSLLAPITDVNLSNIDNETPLHIAFEYIDDDIFNYYVEQLIHNSDLNIQNKDGNSCLHYFFKYNIWKHYKTTLENKQLNIFLKNKDNIRPIDNVKKTQVDEVIDMVIKSYLNLLKNGSDWLHEWENICGKTGWTKEEGKIIRKYTNKRNNECYNIIKDKLLLLIDKKDYQCNNLSFPLEKDSIDIKLCEEIEEKENLSYCTFSGNVLDVLSGLIYLTQKYNYACSLIIVNKITNSKLCAYYTRYGIPIDMSCSIINFEIMWISGKLFIMDNFGEIINNCKERFILIPLGIIMKHMAHANYLIYDKELQEVERFEPHGSGYPVDMNYKPDILDDSLEKIFKNIHNNIKYIRPADYLPKIGLQILDLIEEKNKKLGDPQGFCALWSMWYADLRLKYPDVNRKDLIAKVIKQLKTKNMSFRNLIRNYSKSVIDLRDELLEKSNLTINDWINRNFNEFNLKLMYDNILSKLTR